MSPPIMQNRKREHHLNKMKLALPLKQRLQIVADSSQDDSSSSDGTPQRRILLEDPRYEIELSTGEVEQGAQGAQLRTHFFTIFINFQ